MTSLRNVPLATKIIIEEKQEGMKQYLTVTPFGGLCNRLRVALSAYAATEEIGKQVYVDWCSDFECSAYFDELFLPLQKTNFMVRRQKWWNDRPRKRNFRLPMQWRKLLYGVQKDWFRAGDEKSLLIFANKANRAWLSACLSLREFPDELYGLLRPQPGIQAQIDELKRKINGKEFVGVHIRRTDHAHAIARSSAEDFRKAMDVEIERNNRVCFYLATDDIKLKRQFLEAYPERIFFQSIPDCRRDTKVGMEQAVVDLWLLSGAVKVLGSSESSYTRTAAKMGKIPLQEVETKHLEQD